MRPARAASREIRDPIHGAIPVDAGEYAVIDDPFVQRLRGIRQLGFSHLPFPGATHTRFAHSLGVMHLAGRAFDAVFRDDPFPSPDRRRALRSAVRLAGLCHDLGHPPFSHAAEFAMPLRRELPLDAYGPAARSARGDERALHEDYTVAILTASTLADTIAAHFPFTGRHVAALVSPEVAVDDDFFVVEGHDLRGVLSQLVSSNLDADRLDYLVRDAGYTGARYGEVDTGWLISHLGRHVGEDGEVCLALDGRALYAFDDFMVARYHMFVMVYFHQKSIAYEEMLKRCLAGADDPWRLPADLEAYRRTDDVELLAWLRRSDDPWARRIVERRPWKVAVEQHGALDEVDLSEQRARLEDAGIEVIEAAASSAILDPRKTAALPIYVQGGQGGGEGTRTLEEAASIFRRYSDGRRIGRLYVDPAHLDRARALLR